MNIAVFADLHGRILLSFKLCARWEQETGEHIDLILQAGDLGAFPDEARLDKATRKYALIDPTELGFMTYFTQRNADALAVLERVDADLLFVRGNHEDHAWLDTLEQQASESAFAVDYYRRVYCLKSGVPYTFQHGSETLTILGIGRIAVRDGEEVNPLLPQYIQPHELARLQTPGEFDVLLTHDAPRNLIYADKGIEEIRLLLNKYKPAYHFFGHYGGPCKQRLDSNGVTLSCKLADLHWDRSHAGLPLEAGSMSILRWKDRQEHHFEIIDAPWFKEYSASTWEHL